MSEYINRDTFLDRERTWYCDNCDRRKNSKGKTVYEIGEAPCRACNIGDVLDALEDYPAADVRPVVRGRWDDKPVAFFLKCSECGCCVGHRYDVFLDRGELNYCPNCGAQMQGDGKDE